MEQKTKVHAEDGKQEILITREFDLPLEQLFRAYEEPDLLEQWMGTRVVRMENRRYGSFEFETSRNGVLLFRANGTIHEFVRNRKITRTFEMNDTPFPVQLEFLEFESLGENKSKLNMHIVFKSVKFRDELLKMPFAMGINAAHNQLQKTIEQLKSAGA
jgi:uncharacterized protein YndB with AHSA1/START domain